MIDANQAFSGFSVDNLETARDFYENTLRLKVTEGIMGLLELHVGNGNPVIIYPKENHQPPPLPFSIFVLMTCVLKFPV